MERLFVSSFAASLSLLAFLWGIAVMLSLRVKGVIDRESRNQQSSLQREQPPQEPGPHSRPGLLAFSFTILGIIALYVLKQSASHDAGLEALYLLTLGALAAVPISQGLEIARSLSESRHRRFKGSSLGDSTTASDRMRVRRDNLLVNATLFCVAAILSRSWFFAGASLESALIAARMQSPISRRLMQEMHE